MHAAFAGALARRTAATTHTAIVPIRGLDPEAAVDLDAKYLPFMLENGIRAMITRPDFYVFGGVRKREDLPALVDALLTSLRSHGWQKADAASRVPDLALN